MIAWRCVSDLVYCLGYVADLSHSTYNCFSNFILGKTKKLKVRYL